MLAFWLNSLLSLRLWLTFSIIVYNFNILLEFLLSSWWNYVFLIVLFICTFTEKTRLLFYESNLLTNHLVFKSPHCTSKVLKVPISNLHVEPYLIIFVLIPLVKYNGDMKKLYVLLVLGCHGFINHNSKNIFIIGWFKSQTTAPTHHWCCEEHTGFTKRTSSSRRTSISGMTIKFYLYFYLC